LKTKSELDSKFRFVILAAKRAKQLLHGAKPKIKSKSKNLIRVAQQEVRDGLVDFELVEVKKEEILEPTDEGFIGEEITQAPEEIEKESKKPKTKKKKPEKKQNAKEDKKPQKKPAKKSTTTVKTQKKTSPKKTQKKKT
jgi:DNA-directed RNA polymerase subunit omega